MLQIGSKLSYLTTPTFALATLAALFTYTLMDIVILLPSMLYI